MAVVVEVADERRGAAGVEHPLLDFGNRGGRLRQVHRDAHHLRSGFGQLDALLRRRRRIRRVGHRHRLDDEGAPPPTWTRPTRTPTVLWRRATKTPA